MTTPLVLYGTAGASAVLASAAKYCTNAIGGATTSVANKCGTSTGISEFCGLGTSNAWSAAGSIPAPTGNGWLYDTSLAGSNTPYGPWCGLHTLLTSVGSLTGCVMTIRYYVYNSNTTAYTQLGTSANTSFTINTVATTFSVPDVNIASHTWVTNEYLYVDAWLNIGTNSTGSSSATVKTGCVTSGQTAGWEGYALVSTPGLGTGFDTYEYDNCNRVTQSGFGTASDGSSWSVALGTAGNLTQSVTQVGLDGYTTQAVRLLCTATSTYVMTLGSGTGCPDTEINTCIMPGVTVAAFKQGVVGRWLDTTHYYACVIENALLQLMKESGTSLSTGAFVFSANTSYRMRFRLQGTTLMGKVWRSNASEPSAWNFSTTNVAHLLHGKYGIFYLPDATTSQACYWNYTTNDLNRLLSAGGRFCLADVGTTPYPTVIMADTPSVYYRMGEEAVLEIQDYSGHGYNGSSQGTTQIDALATGAIKNDSNTAIKYSGTPHHLVQGGFTTNAWVNFTVECWFKLTSTVFAANMRLANNSHTDSDKVGFQFFINANAASLNCSIGNGTTFNTCTYTFSPALTAGTWYHAAATYDNSNILLYFNGVQVAGPTAIVGSMGNPTASMNLARGVPYNSDYLVGSLDEVAVYQLTLSAAQIARHYQLGIDPKWSGRAVISATDSNNTSGRAVLKASNTRDGMGRFLLALPSSTLYGQGRFVQKASATQYLTGRFRQNVAKTLYLTGRAVFRATQSLNATGRATFRVANTINLAGRAKVRVAQSLSASGRFALIRPAGTIIGSIGNAPHATGHGTQTHIFYAANTARWWAFYVSSSGGAGSIFTMSSTDGISWDYGPGASLSHDTSFEGRNLSVTYKNISSHDVVHISLSYMQTNAYTTVWRAELVDQNTINWGTETQIDTMWTGAIGTTYDGNTIIFDSTNKTHVMAGYDNTDPCNVGSWEFPNTDSGTAWTIGSPTNHSLYTAVNQVASHYSCADAFGSGYVFTVQDNGNASPGWTNLKSCIWNNSAWQTVYDVYSSPLASNANPNDWGACMLDSTHALIVRRNVTPGLDYTVGTISGGTTISWSAPSAMPAGVTTPASGSGIALIPDGAGGAYCCVIDSAAGNAIKDTHYASGTWSGWDTLMSTSATRNNIVATPTFTSNTAIVAWTNGSGSPYDIKCTLLTISTEHTLDAQGRFSLLAQTTSNATGRVLFNVAKTLYESGRFVMRALTSSNATGRAQLSVGNTKYDSGRFVLLAAQTLYASGRARVQVATTRYMQGRTQISATSSRNVQSRITLSVARYLSGRFVSGATTTLNATGRLREQVLQTRNESGRALLQAGQTLYESGRFTLSVARYLTGRLRTQVSQTKYGQGRLPLRASATLNLTGRATMRVAQTLYQAGRFSLDIAKNISGRFAVSLSRTKDTSGRMSLRVQASKNITGRARLQVSHSLSLMSRALISVTQQQAASGRLSMRATAQKFLQGRFLVVAQQSLSGMGRVLTNVAQSLSVSGTARVSIGNARNSSGRAKFLAEHLQNAEGLFALAIGINMVKDLQGRFVMLAEGLQSVTGRFSTQVTQSRTLSGRLALAGEVLDDLAGRFLLTLSAPKTLYASGRASINALFTRIAEGRFVLLATATKHISGRLGLQGTQSSSMQGRTALSVGMTPSVTGRLLLNLAQSRTKDMQGRLSMRVLASLASSGRAYVSVALSRSLSGQTRVNVGKSLASSGRFIQNALSSLSTQGRILLVLGKTLNASGRAILSAMRTRDGSGNFRANVSASQSLTGKMYVDVAARLDAIGRFVQSALRSRSSTGRLRVQEHTTQDVQGSVFLSALRSLAAQGSLSLSATRTRSATGFFFIVIYRNNTRSASGRFILYQTPEQTVRVQSARGTVSATGTRNSIRIQSTRNTIQEEQ